MKIREISYQVFPFLNQLASYCVFGNRSDAVFKNEKGYGIRIVKSLGMRSEWEYFKLDLTGLIIESPRGYATLFNKKVRITNMEEMVVAYKDKIVGERIS
jgi:hypothetical protein